MGKIEPKKLDKEKTIMLVCSVMVLSALTLTGVYVKERTKIEDENFVKISDESESEEELEPDKAVIVESAKNPIMREDVIDDSDFSLSREDALESDFGEPLIYEDETTELEAEVNSISPNLSFSKEEGLVWPIVGKVLINYSMDKTVYFKTLDQYKYSPAIMIQAAKGGQITAAADGKVSKIYYDYQYGNCVSVDLGSGYMLTYGQIADVGVKEGDYLNVGDLIGTVANPTKYFTKEGCNVYFQLSCNGEPCDPLNCMG